MKGKAEGKATLSDKVNMGEFLALYKSALSGRWFRQSRERCLVTNLGKLIWVKTQEILLIMENGRK